jgi:hypothetical protein
MLAVLLVLKQVHFLNNEQMISFYVYLDRRYSSRDV